MYNSFGAVSPDITSPHNECENEKECEKCVQINESIREQSRSWGDIVLTSSILQLCLHGSPRGAAARAPSASQEYL